MPLPPHPLLLLRASHLQEIRIVTHKHPIYVLFLGKIYYPPQFLYMRKGVLVFSPFYTFLIFAVWIRVPILFLHCNRKLR